MNYKVFITALLCTVVATSFLVHSQESSKWEPLFTEDLSNADFPDEVWSFDEGILTPSEDQCIWTKKSYDNFVLDLEFKNADGTNSGVFVYCSDTEGRGYVPNSVEVQIADDYNERWANYDKKGQCGAIFGHLAASESRVKKPGKWNKMRITCIDQNISVELNGKVVTEMDMSLWTSATLNPDGSEIPSWLSKPKAELPTMGKIGFQGKHHGAPIWFRKIMIKELK